MHSSCRPRACRAESDDYVHDTALFAAPVLLIVIHYSLLVAPSEHRNAV